MALAKIIFKLDSADLPVKEQHYANISKLLLENAEEVYDGINNETIKNLYRNILDDLKKEKENPQLVKLLQSLLQNKIVLKFFPKTDQEEIFRNVVSTIDSSQHENVLVNYFSVLIQMPSFPNIEEAVLSDLLRRIEDVLSNKKDPASIYSACNYFQKFLKDYEEKLSSFISVLSKIVFIPLCHPSNKVREVSEKSLDMFPKILLYSSDEISTSSLLKLLKESYCKEMLQLFKEKQEIYVLKVWMHVVKALGNALSANLSNITPFFQVIEKGFKSNVDEIIIESFVAWRSLIDSFSGTEGALNDSKRLRFLLKPFKNISRFSENVLSVACDTWMHLAWNLAEHLSGRFSEVCIPLLELTVGKLSNGLSEKISQKGGSDILVKKSCFLLLRFLELPSNDSFNRLSSPKKLPRIPYPSLQTPLDIKIITHHFKEILCVVKIIIEAFGTREDMKSYLDCLMKSVLFIVSTVIEDSNKESAEAVNQFINFLSEIIDAKVYPSQACLKCLESLSKMSRKVLVSHSFNCGSRKPQDILCNSLLKMLLNPHLFPSEFPKRFFAAYNRLIQAGIHESFHPLSNAHKFMHVIRNAVGTITVDGDVLIELWSGIAGTLLEVIEKTQEVNQGDKQEHDFSCMYNVLLFPFEFIFPVHIQQFRTRPVTKLWTSLYKAFICSANLVSTTSVNEACENFCMKLKSCLKEDVLKKPHFIESFCLFLQSIMETIDFVSGSTSGAQGMIEVALMMKRKKPLGNLTSFVDLLVILLKAYQTHYVEAEEDSMQFLGFLQSSAPAIQRKVHIVKNAAPLDILKAFFGEIKSGSTISLSLEQLVDCVAKLFLKSSQKRNLMSHSDAKLEMLWNVITSTVERYYLGPYDSDFLTLMSPLLEATFSHPRRNIKEKSRRFWFATFAPNASSLKFPDSLKNLLKKMKLPLLPDDINPTDFSISPMPDSLLGDSSEIHPSSVPLVLTKPFKSPVSVNGEVSKVAPKEIKQSPKISIDDLPSEEFVKIDTPVVITPRQRNVRKKRSYVPALYNDLSQDTATLLSSSESQDTANSATFEDVPKEPVVETSPKASSGKELFSTGSTSHEDKTSVSKNAKSPTVSKFVEKLDECLNKDQVINAEEFPASLEINNETKISTKFATESTHSALGEKSAKHSEITSDKISVFSKPGDKCLTPRNTRRNSKLSQSFSVSLSEKKSEKLELQKLNKSCIELITLGDSDDIIPSSQGSGESESGVKLSANTSHQKSQPTDDSDLKACENPSKDCLSLEDMKDDDDDMTKNVNFVTSTPLKKSSLPSLSVVSKACATSEENSTSKPDVLSTSNVSDVKIDLAEESNNKVVEDKHQEIVPEGLNQSMEVDIQTNSKETIKDISILLDAVNNLVNTTSEKCNPEPISETSDSITSDVEMKNVSESEIKTGDPSSCGMEEKIHSLNKSDEMKHDNSLPQSSSEPDIKKGSASEFEIKTSVVSTVQEEIPSPYEPVAKRSRLSLKLLEKNSQNEDYSQKLRKKSANTESKPQQKPKKRKFVKKDEISNKKVKNTSKDKKDFAPSMDCENVESDQISNIDENKVMNKDEQNCLESEKFKDFENSELQTKCSNFINEENIEVAGQSLDKKEIDNESTSQNTVNTESCEIFEVHSSNSVDIQNSDLAVVPEGSQSSHSSSQSDNDKSDDMDSQESQLSPKQNEPFHTSTNNVYNADSKNVHLNDDDEIKANNISVIPCSLESFIDSCSSNKMEVANSDVQIPDSLSEPVKSKTDPETENIDSSVRFSAIEDDLSCEMRRIVDSVVDVNCERNGTVNLHENQSVSVQEENLLNSSDPVVSSGKESITCDNKSDSSISEEKEHNTELLSNKIMPNLLPSDSKEKVNYIEEYDSCDVIMSSSSENDSESSVQILTDSTATDTQEVNQNVLNSCEANMAETNPDDSAEKSISQSNNNFSPELDHSYSSKPSEGDELPASKLEEPASKLEEDSSSSEEIDVVTVDPIHAYNASFENLNMDGHEISCLMRDLVIKIEKINIANFCSSVDRNHEGIFKTDIRNTSSNLNHAANKENEDNLAKGSKRRKIKPPIRSPFNFRQRAKIESTKKIPAKNIKAINVTQVKSLSENKDLVIKSLFSKDDLEEEADNSMAKIISSIVDSITVEDDAKTDMLPNIPSSSQMSKAQRLELSTDELTDLNTRLNAQIAHQTRRMKVIADSQTSTENSNDPSHSNTVPENSEESSSTNLSSILKKRKSSGEVSPKKVRKVTFASPLIHELVFDSCAESRTIDAVTMNRIQNLNKKRKKILQEKNKTGKLNSIRATVANESEDSPSSSSEYQDSDILDFNDLPVSPALINCPDDIAYIIRHLTSPSWVRGLESLLASKNIKTIGDLCKLNIHQVKALPFKSPKVMTLHKALVEYIDATQENTLQNFKKIDNGSFVEMNDSVASHSTEDCKSEKKEENLEDNAVLLEETIRDILKKDSLKELPLNLLGQLVEACGKAIIEKNQSS